jgi:hypothetical protein
MRVFVLFCVLASACASAPPPIPTPEKPRVGCIPATMKQQGSVPGRLLPETVYVIGMTSGADGERWMVIRGTYLKGVCQGENLKDRHACPWLPYDMDAIKFMGCGRETDAFRDLLRQSEEAPTFE